MPSVKVVVLADRPDGSRGLVEAIRTVADCRVVGAAESWLGVDSVDGVIALDRPDARRCLKALSDRTAGRRLPLVCLVRGPYRRPIPEAEALRILRGMAGKLEPALVEAFAASLAMADLQPISESAWFSREPEKADAGWMMATPRLDDPSFTALI